MIISKRQSEWLLTWWCCSYLARFISSLSRHFLHLQTALGTYHRHPADIHRLMIYWFDIFWNNTEVRDAASSLEPTSHQQTQQLYFETPLVWTLIHSQILTHNHTPLNSESSLIHYKITMYNCSYCSLLERQRTSLLLTDPEIPSKVISSSHHIKPSILGPQKQDIIQLGYVGSSTVGWRWWWCRWWYDAINRTLQWF